MRKEQKTYLWPKRRRLWAPLLLSSSSSLSRPRCLVVVLSLSSPHRPIIVLSSSSCRRPLIIVILLSSSRHPRPHPILGLSSSSFPILVVSSCSFPSPFPRRHSPVAIPPSPCPPPLVVVVGGRVLGTRCLRRFSLSSRRSPVVSVPPFPRPRRWPVVLVLVLGC